MAELLSLARGALDLISGERKSSSPAGAFTIRELTGRKRTIDLVGRGLPYRPISFPVAQRATIEYLGGYSEGTASVMGGKYNASTFTGFWKDKFIAPPPGASAGGPLAGVRQVVTQVSGALSGGFGAETGDKVPPIQVDGAPIRSVRDACELMDSVCLEGQLIEVTWDAQRRVGHLLLWDPSWHNPHDMEWSMEFEWTGKGDPVDAPDLTSEADISDALGVIEGMVDDLVATVREFDAILDELEDTVTSVLQRIAYTMELIRDAIASVQRLAYSPRQAAQRTATLLVAVQSDALELSRAFDARPHGYNDHRTVRAAGFGAALTRGSVNAQLAASPPTPGHPTPPQLNLTYSGLMLLPVRDRLVAQTTAKQVQSICRAIIGQAVTRKIAVLRLIQDDIIGEFQAREGQDLRDAALRFYGDPHDWRRIMLFNELHSVALTPGQVVLVPARSEGI